jgi:hypothetical protein
MSRVYIELLGDLSSVNVFPCFRQRLNKVSLDLTTAIPVQWRVVERKLYAKLERFVIKIKIPS